MNAIEILKADHSELRSVMEAELLPARSTRGRLESLTKLAILLDSHGVAQEQHLALALELAGASVEVKEDRDRHGALKRRIRELRSIMGAVTVDE